MAGLPNVIGIKDASSDLGRVALHAALCGDGFIQLSGEDPSAIGFNAHGGVGCISVTANVAPKLCADMQSATLAGDYATARKVNTKLAPLHRALFMAPSPGPTKYALAKLGLSGPEVRLPLVSPPLSVCKEIDRAIEFAGLLE